MPGPHYTLTGYCYERNNRSQTRENLLVDSRFKLYLVHFHSSIRAAKYHLSPLWLDAGRCILLYCPDNFMACCILDLHIKVLAIPVSIMGTKRLF